MYNLDLLKTNGIPKKGSPFLTFVTTTAVFIPILFCFMIGAEYMSNQVQIRFNFEMLDKIKQKLETVPYDQRLDNRLKQELGVGLSTISEIKQSVDRTIQWTSILTEITDSLPENLAIAEVDVKRAIDRLRVPDPKSEVNRKMEVEVITRTLKMTVFNLKPDRTNNDAQSYIKTLNDSELLKEKMESAKIAMIKVEEFGDQMLPCYFIECVFKSGYKAPEETK
ncbi:MAG: hypothetical protein ACIAQZ_13010 [Sedimentisphaeraceae bacterium JB056]